MSGLFIGISVDPDRAVECLDTAKQLWLDHSYICWFDPRSLHCTLAYVEIGERGSYRTVNAMQKVMEQVSLGHPQFSITLDQFAWFGLDEILVLTNPRGQTNLKLAQLAHTLMRRLRGRKLRVMQQQSFRAHVSLGERDMEAAVDIHSSIYNPLPTQQLALRLAVDSLNLYQAVAHREYRIWHTVELAVPKLEREAIAE